jgi:predicted RecB family nuclease
MLDRLASFCRRAPIPSLPAALAATCALALLLAPVRASANPYNVSEVPKMIKEREARKLHDAGIHSTDELLRRAPGPEQRRQLAKQTGIGGARIDQLARCADLLRLQNIGPEFVMLLEAAGVKSIPNLATLSPPALTKKMAALNRTRHIANPAPDEAQTRDWVSQAAKLPAALSAR